MVLACAGSAIIGGLADAAAQDAAPAVQKTQQSACERAPGDLSLAAPERRVTVLPGYPRGVENGTAGTVTLRYTVNAAGRPVDVQAVPELDRPGLTSINEVLTVAPTPDATFRDAAVKAVEQWVYARLYLYRWSSLLDPSAFRDAAVPPAASPPANQRICEDSTGTPLD
jgi:hypothetical protein